jgi:hypothetical protein
LPSASGAVGTVRELGIPIDPAASAAAVLAAVVGYYRETLQKSEVAQDYLRRRGLSGDLADQFKLGFSDRSFGLKLPAKNRKLGAALRERLSSLGVIRDTGHEAMRGSLVVPIFNAAGDATGLYGRKVTYGLRTGTALHLSLPNAEPFWNVQALAVGKSVVLCASVIDALSVYVAGVPTVIAIAGHDAFSDAHLLTLSQSNVENVYVAFRNDEAGVKAAEAVAAKLLATGITVFKVGFPEGQDANDVLTAEGGRDRLAAIVQGAAWVAKPKPRLPPVEPVLPAEPPAATVAPPPPEPQPILSPLDPPEPEAPDLPLEVSETEIVIHVGERRYRIRGLARNTAFDQLKINLMVTKADDVEGAFHADVLDLYASRQRASFVKQAGVELGLPEEIIRHDLGRVLFKLEAIQDEAIRKAKEAATAPPPMTPEEIAAATEFLKAPDLMEQIVADFDRCGVVGEETNKLLGYIAAVSRKLTDPLAVIVQSTSAAGKTSLMESILAFVPPEDRASFSAMTGQALYYMGETTLAHRVLAVAEEAGAERASYALKLLQSEGALTIASTGKEPATGRLVAQEYRVQGPVALFFTTTAVEIDEELANRCIVLTVNEDRDQTRAIHRQQRERETLEGLLAGQRRTEIVKLHQNAQRLLRPLLVVNPFARDLTFIDTRTRTRRDHGKYLALIRAVALLHQHQRPMKSVTRDGQPVEYVEATPADIAIANRLAHELFGHSLDELPPHSRRLLRLLDAMVTAECDQRKISRVDFRFGRKEIRAHTGWSDSQVRTHLAKLVELEHVVVHRGGRGRLFEYELLYDGGGTDGRPFLPGLIDAAALPRRYDEKIAGTDANFAGGSGAPRGPFAPGSPVADNAQIPDHASPSDTGTDPDGQNARPRHGDAVQSYTQPGGDS